MTTLSKDEVVKMAREAGAIISPQWGVASNVGTATFERFATLCRADLVAENAALKQAHEINADTLNAMQVEIDDWKARALKAEQAQEPDCAVHVMEQLVEALDGLFSGDVVVWSLGGSARPRAAITAGQQYLKENGK